LALSHDHDPLRCASLVCRYLGSKAKNLVDIIDGRATESMFAMPTNPLSAAAIAVVGLFGLYTLFFSAKRAWEKAKAELAEPDGPVTRSRSNNSGAAAKLHNKAKSA